MEVFSHLLDVPSKIRLERVNKRFRDCIRKPESWKYNTKLTMSEIGSDRELLSFLKHTKVITELDIFVEEDRVYDPKYFGILLMFSDKLKVTKFSYGTADPADCPKYAQILSCCLGKFADTLEMVEIQCCGEECPLRLTLAAMLPLCQKLTELELGHINEGEGNNAPFLASLVNMSLKKIVLNRFSSMINGEQLADLCNSAKDHSLSNLSINGAWFSGARFQLAEFCDSLEPAAAHAIKSLTLQYVDCGWPELLPTLPAVFRNLNNVDLMYCPRSPTAEDAMKMAQAVGQFLHATAHQEKPVALKLEVDTSLELSFGRWLWNAINLIEVWRNGTKYTADMEHWARTLAHGNVTLSVKQQNIGIPI